MWRDGFCASADSSKAIYYLRDHRWNIFAGQRPIHRCSEIKNVCFLVKPFALNLFRCYIIGCALNARFNSTDTTALAEINYSEGAIVAY